MTSAEVRPLTNNFSELDITEVDDSKRLTLSYMRATEPWTWDSFPSLYHHSKERPRPRFSYGITASDEEIEKVAANLEPRLASYFKKSFPTAFIVVRRHFNQACGLPSMGITFEGVYSKDLDAPYIFSLTNTYDRQNRQHINALEDLLTSELRAVGWGYKTLKWYISDENFNDLDREDWSDPTSNLVIEH